MIFLMRVVHMWPHTSKLNMKITRAIPNRLHQSPFIIWIILVQNSQRFQIINILVSLSLFGTGAEEPTSRDGGQGNMTSLQELNFKLHLCVWMLIDVTAVDTSTNLRKILNCIYIYFGIKLVFDK